jgi:hypothetical protein
MRGMVENAVLRQSRDDADLTYRVAAYRNGFYIVRIVSDPIGHYPTRRAPQSMLQ